jgi:hypothetical protein
MLDQLEWKGLYRIFDNPGHETDYLRFLVQKGHDLSDFCQQTDEFENTVMSSYKQIMLDSSFGLAENLVITSQTFTPADNETGYTGVKYISTPADIIYKTQGTNPFSMGFNIRNSFANGDWGSLILVTASGQMINRALANTKKETGKAKIIDFRGLIT